MCNIKDTHEEPEIKYEIYPTIFHARYRAKCRFFCQSHYIIVNKTFISTPTAVLTDDSRRPSLERSTPSGRDVQIRSGIGEGAPPVLDGDTVVDGDFLGILYPFCFGLFLNLLGPKNKDGGYICV